MMIKGKRTKRPRPLSPLALTMSSATTTDEGGSISAATSEEWAPLNSAATSEEEEDMAHCLILLAQGSNQGTNINNTNTNTNHKGTNNSGVTSYECKTCNKSFSSFQALGGHRASHKKPKPNVVALSEIKKSSSVIFSLINNDNHHHHSNNNNSLKQYDQHFNDDGTTLSLQIANSSSLCTTSTNTNKVKVHECGICRAEFSSGQALGGHMRRHRPIGTTATTVPIPSQSVTIANGIPNNNVKDEKMTRNLLSLDLNLPAPEDEHQQQQQQQQHHQQRESSSKFVFSSNEKTLVFTAASQLVDCHY